jgi:hypothetical protein
MARNEAMSAQDALVQIQPLRVKRLNQVDLALPLTRLELLFTQNGRGHRLVLLEPNQLMYPVLTGEALRDPILVLTDSRTALAGHAHIQRAMTPVGHDVDARIFHTLALPFFGVSVGTCIASVIARNEAIYELPRFAHGLPRRCAPRNDE